MKDQEKPMRAYFGTKGSKGKWIPHFVEFRDLRQKLNKKANRRKVMEYPAEFKKFVAQDKYQESIVTELAQALEKWLKDGVTYSENTPMSSIAGVPVYDNMPIEVQRALKTVQGKIALGVLELKRIRVRLWPEVLMVIGARPLEGDIEREAIFRDFNGNPAGPAVWLMWDSKHISPKDIKDRARFIAENFYELHVMRLLRNSDIKRLTKEAKRLELDEARDWAEVEYDLKLQQELRAQGLDLIDEAEYYALEQGYQPSETATMLRKLGIDKSPREIARTHEKIKNSLPDRKLEKKLKQFIIKTTGT